MRSLEGQDAIVATRFAGNFSDGGDFDALKARTRMVELPVLVFPAFHPDLVYLFDRRRPDTTPVRGPVGDYHSAFALFGFLEGLSEDETARLFAPETCRRLGYLDLWDSSAEALLQAGRVAGWDLSLELTRWARSGVFMHSVNHPRMNVVADLARGVATRLGLSPPEIELDAYLADEFLGQGTWPVYPAIAERYGVPASEVFFTSGKERTRPLSLDVFIEASFATYRLHRADDLVCDRVGQWRSDATVREWLMSQARDPR